MSDISKLLDDILEWIEREEYVADPDSCFKDKVVDSDDLRELLYELREMRS